MMYDVDEDRQQAKARWSRDLSDFLEKLGAEVWSWRPSERYPEYDLFAPNGEKMGTFPSSEAAYAEYKRLTGNGADEGLDAPV